MKVVWSRRAIRHLVSLRQYIEQDSERNAALAAMRVLIRDRPSSEQTGHGPPREGARNARACSARYTLHHPPPRSTRTLGTSGRIPRPPEMARETITYTSGAAG